MLQKIIKSHTKICILAVLLSIGFCQIGLAAGTPTVRIGSAEGSVSDTVDISINIVNASVIGAMDIGLTYDASILKATNVANGAMIESLPDALWSYNISSGKINISFATYPDAINNDGELFIVTFDASVVNVTGVDSGSIGSTTVQLESWTLVDSDTVRVLFNLPGTTGVSGSGSLATIHFTVTGTVGDTSVLDISDGLLVDIRAEEILSTWIDDEVTV